MNLNFLKILQRVMMMAGMAFFLFETRAGYAASPCDIYEHGDSAIEGDIYFFFTPGHLGGDGELTFLDFSAMLEYAAGLRTPQDDCEFIVADCAPARTGGDGKITVGDAYQVLRMLREVGPTNVRATGPLPAADFPVSPAGAGGDVSIAHHWGYQRLCRSLRLDNPNSLVPLLAPL
jgi:hypothetical protein